jgi:hypothetical protein
MALPHAFFSHIDLAINELNVSSKKKWHSFLPAFMC